MLCMFQRITMILVWKWSAYKLKVKQSEDTSDLQTDKEIRKTVYIITDTCSMHSQIETVDVEHNALLYGLCIRISCYLCTLHW